MKRTYPFPPILLPLGVAAVVLIVGLVLPWWKFGSQGIGVFDDGLFPVAALVPVLGLLALLDLCADVVLGLKRPAQIASFTRQQLRTVAAADALVLAAVWFFMGRVEIGLGYWASLIGSAAVLATVLLPARLEMVRQGLADTRVRATLPVSQVLAPEAAVVAPVVAPAVAPEAAAAAAEPAVADLPPVATGQVAPQPMTPANETAALPIPSPSAEFTPRWFCVLEPQPLLDPSDHSRHVATLTPRTWYVARRREGAWLLATGPNDVVGWVAEASVQWAPEKQA
jgi:hypothetical protein